MTTLNQADEWVDDEMAESHGEFPYFEHRDDVWITWWGGCEVGQLWRDGDSWYTEGLGDEAVCHATRRLAIQYAMSRCGNLWTADERVQS